jgi:hypothetical protein
MREAVLCVGVCRAETQEGRLVSDAAGIVQLVGRILFGGYFVFTGAGFHIPKTTMAEEYARSMRFPAPQVAGWPTGVWMVAGGLSIALGIWADVGALMIAAFVGRRRRGSIASGRSRTRRTGSSSRAILGAT